MTAGVMLERIALDRPVQAPDAHGGVETGWQQVAEAKAAVRHLRAGETVLAGRLAGTLTIVVTIYATELTRQATPAWRMRDLRSGEIYNIRSIIPTDDRRNLEITVQSGVAV